MKNIVTSLLANKIATACVATAVLTGGAATIAIARNNNSDTTQKEPAQTVTGPSKEQEQQETDAHKDELAKQYQEQQNNTASPPADQKKSVTPVITNASVEGVSGYVTGVIEEGGSCTYTFTKGDAKFTKTANGVANVSNTSCPFVSLTKNDFSSSGDWQMVFNYDSSNASGSSAAKTITVP